MTCKKKERKTLSTRNLCSCWRSVGHLYAQPNLRFIPSDTFASALTLCNLPKTNFEILIYRDIVLSRKLKKNTRDPSHFQNLSSHFPFLSLHLTLTSTKLKRVVTTGAQVQGTSERVSGSCCEIRVTRDSQLIICPLLTCTGT